MKKGKFGIDLRFFAILSFVLAFTGWTVPLLMILGYAILAEKDEWLTRQTMQATMLLLVTSVYSGIVSLFSRNFGVYQSSGVKYLSEIGFGDWANYIYFLITNALQGILYILVAIFVIVAISKVAKGKDAGLPLFSKWAYKAYGIIPAAVAQPYGQAQQQYQQAQQQQGQQYQQPQAPQAPQAQQYQQPQAQQYQRSYQAPVAPQAPNNQNTPPTEQK